MEYFKPTVEEFGSSEKYKVLAFLFDYTEKSDVKEKAIIRRMLVKINNTARTEVSKSSPYVFKLVLNDFKAQIERLDLPTAVKGYLNNYLKAKFVNSIETVENFVAKNSSEVWNKKRLDNIAK